MDVEGIDGHQDAMYARGEVIGASAKEVSDAPFSPGRVIDGKLIMLAGQGGFDPDTGALVSSSMEEQTTQTLRNVETLLTKHGSSLDSVMSCLVQLSDPDLYPAFDPVYERFFSPPRPVR